MKHRIFELTPQRVAFGVGVVLVVVFTYNGWKGSQKQPMPPEVRTAKDAFHKLSAALEIGVPYIEYNRYLIELKTAVTAADSKLPAVVDPRIMKGENVTTGDYNNTKLQVGHKAMLDAMDIYKEAQMVWDTKIKGKHLWDTPEGSKLRWDHRFAASMTEDDILQSLWTSAASKAVDFDISTDAYSQ